MVPTRLLLSQRVGSEHRRLHLLHTCTSLIHVPDIELGALMLPNTNLGYGDEVEGVYEEEEVEEDLVGQASSRSSLRQAPC